MPNGTQNFHRATIGGEFKGRARFRSLVHGTCIETNGLVIPSQAAAVLEGRAIGALVLTGFAAGWMLFAFRFVKRFGWGTLLGTIVITAGLCWGAARQMQRARRMPHAAVASPPTAAARETGRQFQIVLALEWIPILAAVIIFRRMKRPDFILPTIALIVGLHFIPLARVFGVPLYYASGTAIVLVAIAGFFAKPPARQAIACIGSGVVLWITAALLLV